MLSDCDQAARYADEALSYSLATHRAVATRDGVQDLASLIAGEEAVRTASRASDTERAVADAVVQQMEQYQAERISHSAAARRS